MKPTYLLQWTCFFLLSGSSLLLSGCAFKDSLHEYETRGATLAVEAPLAAFAEIVIAPGADAQSPEYTPLENLILATPAIINTARAEKAQVRLERASEKVDVALRVAEGILDRTEPELNMVPTDYVDGADYVLRIEITNHGIHTAKGLTAFLSAHTTLYDQQRGKRIWVREVEISKKLSGQGVFRNLKATKELSEMRDEDFVEVLEMISDYAADGITDILCNSLETR